MEALLSAIADIMRALFSDQRNIALTISMSANVALAWAHVVWRREEREDRKAALETFGKVTDALNGVKNALAALSGRVS